MMSSLSQNLDAPTTHECPEKIINDARTVLVEQCPEDRTSPSNSSSLSDSLTPETTASTSSPEIPRSIGFVPGTFNDPKHNIAETNPETYNGLLIPKVLIPSDMWAEAVDNDIWHETFTVPAHMGGVLIGRNGKLSCPVRYKDDVLRWVNKRFRMRPSRTPIGNPDVLKRRLPFGESVPVIVRNLYGGTELFVTINDKSFCDYREMQIELDEDYHDVNSFRSQLCEPVTVGTVAIVPHTDGHGRAVILNVFDINPKYVLYFLLDHGTFGVIELNKLRKIRAKYMKVPFQAIHVNWAHARPLFNDIPDLHVLRTFFSESQVNAFAVRNETCCRPSVVITEPGRFPYPSTGEVDILHKAWANGLYVPVPLCIMNKQQMITNGTDRPYYQYTGGQLDYTPFIYMMNDDVMFESQPMPTSPQPNDFNHYPEFYHQRGGGRPYRPFATWHGRGQQMRPRYNGIQKENRVASPCQSVEQNEESKNTDSEQSTESLDAQRRPLTSRNFLRGGASNNNFHHHNYRVNGFHRGRPVSYSSRR